MATVAPVPYSPSIPHIPQEDRSCGGCHESVEVDSGGVVVAFGNSLWHVDCFKCAKCGDRVSADTNLLLLSDGSPVCTSCTYNCAVCKSPISDEAIMTGDESYHAACFTCKTCGRHIGELVFAKTTQGIYCMACHNERVARSRRHAEQRRNKIKPRRDGQRDKDKEKLQETYTQLRDSSFATNEPQSPPSTPGLHNPQITSADSAVSSAAKRISTQSVASTLQKSRYPAKPLQLEIPPASPAFKPALPSPTVTTTHPPEPSHSVLNVTSTLHEKVLPLPRDAHSLGPRSKSFDNGARSPNGLLDPEYVSSPGLAPDSVGGMIRTDKRASDNPVRSGWSANRMLSEVRLHHSPISLSPTGDISKRSPSRSRDSDERSPSPYSQGRQKGSPLPHSPTAQFYPSPPSPFSQNGTYPLSPVENPIAQAAEPTMPNDPTLSDQARPMLHHKPSNQHMTSARTSPIPSDSAAVKDTTGAYAPQSSIPTQSCVDTPDRELPKLPAEAEATTSRRGSRDTQRDEEEVQPTSLVLPLMSFSDTDTSFNDLLKLGHKQSMQPITPPANERPKPDNTGVHAPLEAGHSKTASPTSPSGPAASLSFPHQVKSASPPTTKTLSPVQSTLNNLPKRSASLVHRGNSRKPAPQAIVLPESFQTNASLITNNGPLSLGSTSRPRLTRKLSNSVASPSRRPASAGSGALPPLSQQNKGRRSSDNTQPSASVATDATPMRSDSTPSVTFVDVSSDRTARPVLGKSDTSELVVKRIKEALTDVHENGVSSVRLDREFLEVVCLTLQTNQEKLREVQKKFDGMRRTSQQFIDGLSVAQEEYDRELASRREAEAEVTRLKVQLSGQAAQLTQLSAEGRKRAVGEQMSRDMSANLDGLERDLSRIMAERDLVVAEVEELAASKMASNHGDAGLQRSLTHRFDTLKAQYKRELEPLLQQRESLLREINELKEERNICLEETTALNARNEELARLNAQTARNAGAMRTWQSVPTAMGAQQYQSSPSTPRPPPISSVQGSSYYGSTTTIISSQEEREEPKATPIEKRSKWFKPSRELMRPINDVHAPPVPEKEALGHNFQQLTMLRVARCDNCGDKMWGTQLRCNVCHLSCHNRCVGQVNTVCGSETRPRDDVTSQASIFGRDLREQVRADSMREHRDIPILVEKCIEAVELLAMDYEGVYRKSGGSAQSKIITQLFERGNYDAFDLGNAEIFNDISSVTSVLKTYFRQLPNPLLTNALHEAFIGAASHRDPRVKADSLSSLVYQLPSEHFHTLRYLMLHLYRVQLRSAENLMNARNLGVVFGPTLMRSSDPNREFADMAGKALTIEWLVENALTIFRENA